MVPSPSECAKTDKGAVVAGDRSRPAAAAAAAPDQTGPPARGRLAIVRLFAFAVTLSLASHLAPQVLVPVYGSALATSPLAPFFALVLALAARPAPVDDASSALLVAASLAGAESWLRAVGSQSDWLGTWAGPALGWLVVCGWSAFAVGQAAQRVLLYYIPSHHVARLMAGLLAAALVSPPMSPCWALVPLVQSDRLSASRKMGTLGGISFAFAAVLPALPGAGHLTSSTANSRRSWLPPMTAALLRSPFPYLLLLLSILAQPTFPFLYPSDDLVPYPLLATTPARSAFGLGLLQVGENHDLGPDIPPEARGGYRFLRADHSLLGGRWVGSIAERASETGGVGDSIFSAFVLQEGVRLVDRPASRAPQDEQESALIIGLGVGIAARSMILHNLTTTVVEYDPAVYSYARDYFDLPELAHVFLEDAAQWVEKSALALQDSEGDAAASQRFSFVIHDVFTGGQVPGELFTLEFWADLQKLMSPSGVLAVNFAAVQHTAGAQAVIATLLASWAQCAGFRDAMGEPAEADLDGTELRNLVIFCTPFASPRGLLFRQPVAADFHASRLRQQALSSFTRHPVDLHALADGAAKPGAEAHMLRKGRAGARLRQLQGRGEGEATWRAMRALMPARVWNRW